MKKVQDFMNRKVIYFSPNDSIFSVAKVFCDKNISGAPVVDKDKVIGVISESDILKFMNMRIGKRQRLCYLSTAFMLFSLIKDYSKVKEDLERISKTKVKDVMSKKAIFIEPEADLFDAVNMMDKNEINRLPVIKDKKLVGIIARADLLKALVA